MCSSRMPHLKGAFLSVSVFLGVCSADAFEVRQFFRPERYTRGNVNLAVLQPLDEAAWLWTDDAPFRDANDRAKDAGSFPIVRFRCEFTAHGEPLKFDVTADPRFVLLLDGQVIARGPHKGCHDRWYYESYEISALPAGAHTLEAVVFYLGNRGPRSILSMDQGGFALKAEGAYDASLTTGKATWRAAKVPCMTYGPRTDGRVMTGGENVVHGTGFLDWSDLNWQSPRVVRQPLKRAATGFYPRSWRLFPTERADDLEVVKVPGRVCAVRPDFANPEVPYAQEDATHRLVKPFGALLRRGEPVVIPPHETVRVLWDLEDYYCAYPQMTVSGGAGATIRWSWAETLFETNITGHCNLFKGDRGQFVGKRNFLAMHDTFLPDGRETARFTTPWWKCGRWVEISIRTREAPLEIRALSIAETRYPMEASATFACDDPTLEAVQRICVRGLQCCMHEMFMDCPYFEQQMYPGDTRVEMLTLNAINGDPRMIRYGIGIFDVSRRENGMVRMNFPSVDGQDSSTYSMCWLMMLGDYVLWHGADDFVRARMPGARHTLSVIDTYRNAQGVLEGLPGWNFHDWPESKAWGYGTPPGAKEGLTALDTLLFIHALKSVAKAERAIGETELAAIWERKAADYAQAARALFWSEVRGLFADTPKHDTFCEHAQCLALLADILPPDQATRTFKALVSDKDLVPTTVYFSHYLFDTYLRFGRADLFLKRLDLWRGYVAQGLKTPQEAPGIAGRSDCHAWGAHPLYHLQTGVAGIRPASDGFATVCVAPQPAGLKFIRAKSPTPKGPVAVDLQFAGDRVTGCVTLPPAMTGSFVWRGMTQPLQAGANDIAR